MAFIDKIGTKPIGTPPLILIGKINRGVQNGTKRHTIRGQQQHQVDTDVLVLVSSLGG